ncbi:MAG: penicillin-binding protein 1A [Gammaproteobacteria bacterium]
MRIFAKITALLTALAAAGIFSGVLVALIAYVYLAPTLPDVAGYSDVKMQVPLRIFTRDGRLMAEFGDKRRIPVSFDDLPPQVVNAFTSAEDDRFFEHPGVDYQGLIRAVMKLISTGGQRSQGGSTITMQLARNLFLIPDKTYKRKLQEIFLSLKMEREASKEQILALYLNKIFLGQRAYGVAAAAEVYFGKSLDELTLGEAATLAGLPQSPSYDNPVRNAERAKGRRAYVLRRMYELGYIDQAERDAALAEGMVATLHATTVGVKAPYVAEMVRADIEKRLGREAINEGYRVITTLDSGLQRSAVDALRVNLHAYDRRHGYRGVITNVAEMPQEEADVALKDVPRVAGLTPAQVIAVDEEAARLMLIDGAELALTTSDLEWARRYIDDDTLGDKIERPADVLAIGDLVYVKPSEEDVTRFTLAQTPAIQGAMVALDPLDGAIAALTGGFDFFQNKFNRAVQARRQPGSAFKPFVYSAALENGLTPATVINDAPIVFADDTLDDTWRPKNYGGVFGGPTRLREALVRSRNLVSIRLLNDVGIPFTVDHLANFGFNADELPRDLSLALGSATVTPLELANAYTVFANGGYDVEPYFIDRIEDADGNLVFASDPIMVCHDCVELDALQEEELDPCVRTANVALGEIAPRVLSPQNAYLMTDMMHDVVTRGTGAKANQLGRGDLAGKTGTTNDLRDAWFSGFNQSLVAVTWVGFDKERSLGRGEAGSSTALPGWILFMRAALEGVDQRLPQEPEGLVTVRISRESGLLASSGASDAIFETFRQDNVPTRAAFELEFGGQDEDTQYDQGDIF